MHLRIKSTKHKRILTRIGLFAIVVLMVLQVVVSNQLATKGLEIVEIQGKIADIEEENARLSQEIASASAFLRVQNEAYSLGFINKIKPVYLGKDKSVAIELH